MENVPGPAPPAMGTVPNVMTKVDHESVEGRGPLWTERPSQNAREVEPPTGRCPPVPVDGPRGPTLASKKNHGGEVDPRRQFGKE